MSNFGIFGIIAVIVIVLALIGWIYLILRAQRDPEQSKHAHGKLKRGPVSGGAIRGDPGQNILTGEAPQMNEPRQDRPPDR